MHVDPTSETQPREVVNRQFDTLQYYEQTPIYSSKTLNEPNGTSHYQRCNYVRASVHGKIIA